MILRLVLCAGYDTISFLNVDRTLQTLLPANLPVGIVSSDCVVISKLFLYLNSK